MRENGDGMKRTLITIATVGALLSVGQVATAADEGKATYDKVCAVCHAKGIAGAPKLGDKSLWEPRIKLGVDALTASVIAGKGVMAPRAGVASLSDADIKSAVNYMIVQVK
jgi:cytochrome c5